MNIKDLKIGKNYPDAVNVVIEIPKGSHNKYEYDEEDDVIKLDRVLYSPVFYPTNYGFIPETRSDDGDHLDMLILSTNPIDIGAVVEARPVGLLKMIDDSEEDFKILGIATKDPRFIHVKSLEEIDQLNPLLRKEIMHFFEVYKKLEDKKTEMLGWENNGAAAEEVKRAHESYKKRG